MRRYVRLLGAFARACLVQETAYRSTFWSNAVQTVVGLGVVMLTLALFFQHTGTIGGWAFWEVFVLLGVFTTLSGTVDFFLRPNLGKMVEYIQKGTLDFVLVKPVDSQFFISLRHLAFFKGVDILLGLGMSGAGLWIGGRLPSLTAVLSFFGMLAAAVAILYSAWLLLMTMAFWFVKVDNLHVIFSSFFETARFPVSVYKGWLRLLLTYVVPIAFVTTTPSSALTGRLEYSGAGGSLLAAAAALLLTRWFWRRALRHYASASS